jgi:hypothetical protein
MSREERQALLHEGVSVTNTLSAYGQSVVATQFLLLYEQIHSGDYLRQQ